MGLVAQEVVLLERVMEHFVIQRKVEHYRAMIKNATDLERRGVFERLLLEEEIKLRKIEEDRATRNNTPAN